MLIESIIQWAKGTYVPLGDDVYHFFTHIKGNPSHVCQVTDEDHIRLELEPEVSTLDFANGVKFDGLRSTSGLHNRHGELAASEEICSAREISRKTKAS